MLRCGDRDLNGPLAFEGPAIELQAYRRFIRSGHQDDARARFEHPGAICSHLVKGESVRGMLDSDAPDTGLTQATEESCDHSGLALARTSHHPDDQRSGMCCGDVKFLPILWPVEQQHGCV